MKKKKNGCLVGPCPFCGTGRRRFTIFPEGNYTCNVCHAKGWVNPNDKRTLPVKGKYIAADDPKNKSR